MPPIGYFFWFAFVALVFIGGWGGYTTWPENRRWFGPVWVLLMFCIGLLGYGLYGK